MEPAIRNIVERIKLTWKTGSVQANIKILAVFLAIQGLLLFLFLNSQQPQTKVYIEEGAKDVLLKSVLDYGAILEYKVNFLRAFEPGDISDGVYLLAITSANEEEEGTESVANCLLIRDTVGYKEASYTFGMFDCDRYPEIDGEEDKVEITPLSVGDLLEDSSRGFYSLELPGNVIPGYTKPIRCFCFAHVQGSLGVLTGYSGMACDFSGMEPAP